jgi:nicotinate-nucleotide--dimethylbenzimidazole phosphoribosyltransferase
MEESMNLESIIAGITNTNGKFADQAQQRLDSLTKPKGSLGRLEEFAKQLVAITETSMPELGKKVVFTFAGDHGVAEEGVSAFPREVTPQMVLNFINGGAGINVLARHAGAEVVVVDIGVDYDFSNIGALPSVPLHIKKVVSGTKNIRKGPAMTREEAERCIQVGFELADEYAKKGFMIFGTGDMGIANTTPSSAITAVLTEKTVEEITGRGTGINDEVWNNKVQVIKDSIDVNRPDVQDPVDVLAKIGGAEIGGIAGLIMGAAANKIPVVVDGVDVLAKIGGAEIGGIAGLIMGAAANKIPVVVDGFISTAGALIAYLIEPRTKDYMFAAHMSEEVGHRAMLEGLKIYKEMATFAEAEVAERNQD